MSDFLFVIILVVAACSKFELPLVLEDELKRDWAVQALLLRQEDVKGKYEQVTFSGKELLTACCHHFQQFVKSFTKNIMTVFCTLKGWSDFCPVRLLCLACCEWWSG